MEDFLPGQQERYELGPDVAAEVDEMYRLDVDAKPELDLVFDPQAFQQEHPQPLLKDWALGQAELEEKAKQTTELRARIAEKAKLCLHDNKITLFHASTDVHDPLS